MKRISAYLILIAVACSLYGAVVTMGQPHGF